MQHTWVYTPVVSGTWVYTPVVSGSRQAI
jgi:hypothetical protein